MYLVLSTYLQNLDSIQSRTSLVQFALSPHTDRPGVYHRHPALRGRSGCRGSRPVHHAPGGVQNGFHGRHRLFTALFTADKPSSMPRNLKCVIPEYFNMIHQFKFSFLKFTQFKHIMLMLSIRNETSQILQNLAEFREISHQNEFGEQHLVTPRGCW